MTGPRDERDLQRRARELYDRAEGNPRRLAMMAAQMQVAAQEAREHGPLMVVAGVSAMTGKPYVQIEWGQNRGQVDVDEARGFARNVLEACANGVAEAALLEWARDELDLDLERAARLIDALRHYRHDRWGQPDLDLEFEQPPPEEAP
jgi:hypothetical protein